MATIQEACPNCGTPIAVQVGQVYDPPRLLWYKSYSCPHCKGQLEVDGSDDLDTEARQAILAQEGQWELRVDESGSRGLLAIKTLRQALGLSLTEVGPLTKRLPGIVATGTRAEMERLHSLMSGRSLRAMVTRTEGKLMPTDNTP